MQRADVHRIPHGPLAVRWLGYELEPARAGASFRARIAFENAGGLGWHGGPPNTIAAGYHWLDRRGNPIVWDGFWQPVGRPLAPGEQTEVALEVRAPLPPGRYRLAFDLVSEGRFWFEEIGNVPLSVDVDVRPRIERRALAVRGVELPGFVPEDEAEAVAYLAPGCVPAPDWAERILDAHADGYAVVGGSVELAGSLLERRRAARTFAPWTPGRGRNPTFEHPLLFPSVLRGVDLELTDVDGLPAARPPTGEPWVYDARAVVRARPPGGRPRA